MALLTGIIGPESGCDKENIAGMLMSNKNRAATWGRVFHAGEYVQPSPVLSGRIARPAHYAGPRIPTRILELPLRMENVISSPALEREA